MRRFILAAVLAVAVLACWLTPKSEAFWFGRGYYGAYYGSPYVYSSPYTYAYSAPYGYYAPYSYYPSYSYPLGRVGVSFSYGAAPYYGGYYGGYYGPSYYSYPTYYSYPRYYYRGW